MSATFVDHVATKAAEVQASRLLLSLVAAPFYLLGLIVGVAWVVGVWAVAAVQVGVGDARERAGRRRGDG